VRNPCFELRTPSVESLLVTPFLPRAALPMPACGVGHRIVKRIKARSLQERLEVRLHPNPAVKRPPKSRDPPRAILGRKY
jgi:hypothetical protein